MGFKNPLLCILTAIPRSMLAVVNLRATGFNRRLYKYIKDLYRKNFLFNPAGSRDQNLNYFASRRMLIYYLVSLQIFIKVNIRKAAALTYQSRVNITLFDYFT